ADGAAEQVSHELFAVADAQHRRTEVEDLRIYSGTAGIVDAARAARDDDAPNAREIRGRRLAGAHLRVHAEVADPTGNQVTILASGVQNCYLRFGVQVR